MTSPLARCARCEHQACDHVLLDEGLGACRLIVQNEDQRMPCFCAKFVPEEKTMPITQDDGPRPTIIQATHAVSHALEVLNGHVSRLEAKLQPVLIPHLPKDGPEGRGDSVDQSKAPLAEQLMVLRDITRQISDHISDLYRRLDLEDPGEAEKEPEVPYTRHDVRPGTGRTY